MAWKLNEKLRVIAVLQRLHQNGQKLEMELRVKHPEEDADRVWEANQRLALEIDSLLGRAMDDWGMAASTAQRQLEGATESFKSAVADIKKKMNVVRKIIDASRYLDDAVKVARKVLDALA